MGFNKNAPLNKFIDKFGYTPILNAVKEYISDQTRDYDSYHDVEVDDMDLSASRKLIVKGTNFSFEAGFTLHLKYHDDYGDEKMTYPWVLVTCECEVDRDLKCFNVISVEDYYKTNDWKRNTSRSFVPFLSTSELDLQAAIFLQEYCPEALEAPMTVPIQEIAMKKMGLILHTGYALTNDFSNFGQICFAKTKVTVFDDISGVSKEIDVERGTVLIDPAVFWQRNIGCMNFTVAHEVVHWEKHRLYADIQHLLTRGAYTAHRCPKPKSRPRFENDEMTDSERLEAQANGIGARILMPLQTLPIKIEEFAKYNSSLKGRKFYTALIDELADFYKVSRQTAKYRLQDLGYEVGNIQLHEYDMGEFTHKIETSQAFYEYCENPEFKQLVDYGLFIYADNYFVINCTKTVEYDENGVPHLTLFALENIEKCTLKFENIRIRIKKDDVYSEFLFKGNIHEIIQKYDKANNNETHTFMMELAQEVSGDIQDQLKLGISFPQKMKNLFEAKKITWTKFCDKTLLNKNVYYDLQKDGYKPTKPTILAVVIGLTLDINLSNEILNSAGFALGQSPEDKTYSFVITNLSHWDIYKKNDFLVKSGLKALGMKDNINEEVLV